MTKTVITARDPNSTALEGPKIATSRCSSIALALLLLGACGAADDGGAMGGQSGDPGSGGGTVCQGQRWDGPESPWISADCGKSGENQWRCECVEQDPGGDYRLFGSGAPPVAVEAEGCAAALKASCDVDVDAPVFCSTGDLGTCWPAVGDTWSCECGAAVGTAHMQSQACLDTLWAACGDQCETPFGSCGEVRDTRYRCQCTGVEGPLPADPPPPQTFPDGSVTTASPPPTSSTCAEAMQKYCGDRCASSAGQCEPEEDGFACSCNSGTEGHVTFDSLGGISPSACSSALQTTCGGS